VKGSMLLKLSRGTIGAASFSYPRSVNIFSFARALNSSSAANEGREEEKASSAALAALRYLSPRQQASITPAAQTPPRNANRGIACARLVACTSVTACSSSSGGTPHTPPCRKQTRWANLGSIYGVPKLAYKQRACWHVPVLYAMAELLPQCGHKWAGKDSKRAATS